MSSNIRYSMYMVFAVTLLAIVPPAMAVTAGTTGGQLLELMPDGRTGGMGETFCALADDSNCLFYNPAGLGVIRWTEIPLASNQLFGGVNHQFIGFTYSFRDFRSSNLADLGTIAVGYNELVSGDIEGFSAAGLRTVNYNVKDKLWTVAYGKALFDREETGTVAIGASVKLLSEEIAGHTSDNNVFDGGLLWRLPSSNLSLGVAALNMGSKLSYAQDSFDPPTIIKGGVGFIAPDGNLRLGVDVNNPYHEDMFYSAGAEYYLLRALALRAGYNSRSDQGGITFGFGISIRQIDFMFWMYARELTIDYAFVPMGDLGNTQRISLILKLGAD